MEDNITNNRCRMNISTNAKGLVQFDITCEYDTPEISAENLDKSIKLLKETIKNNELILAG